VAVEVAGGDGAALTTAAAPSEEAIRRDGLVRQMMAIRRIEREGRRLEQDLERRRSEFARHERETIQQLEAAGYLHHRPAER
jgi:hypothetical protein